MRGKDHFGDISIDGRMTLKSILKNPIHILTLYVAGCELDSTGSVVSSGNLF
jgi:hypothetical protein